MIALVETVGTEVKIELFNSLETVETAMKERYNRDVKAAKYIRWKGTWFNWEKKYAVIDDWDSVKEFRVFVDEAAKI